MAEGGQIVRTAYDDFNGELMLRRVQIEKVLPKQMTVDRFVAQCQFALSRNPKLLECTKRSFTSAVLALAELGLDPSGNLGSGYLAPFSQKGTLEVVPIPGYRGLIDLAVRSAEVRGIDADVVFWGDEFDFERGDRPRLHHKPAFPKTKEEQALVQSQRTWDNVRAAYAVATLRSGLKQWRVMLFEELEVIRRRAPGGKSEHTPWAPENFQEPKKGGSRIEMYRKSPIRALCKLLPLSPVKAQDLHKALALDDETEAREWDDENETPATEKRARSGADALRSAMSKQVEQQRAVVDAEVMDTDAYAETGPVPPDDVKLPTPGKK